MEREVNLCGILYRMIEREGTIIFVEAYPVWGQGTTMRFWMPDGTMMWYMSLHGDAPDKIAVSHILAAYRLIIEKHGDPHGMSGL